MQILKEETPFVHKAIAALAISIVSDALDYFAAPYLTSQLLEMYLMLLLLTCYIP